MAVSGYVEVTLSSGTTTLSLADGDATANGKNLYIKVTGTLSGNASLTMPATTSGGNANRVFFVEDGTTRGGAGDSYTVTLLTTGQSAATQVPLPEGATVLVYSKGSVPATTLGMLQKGMTSVTAAGSTSVGIDTEGITTDNWIESGSGRIAITGIGTENTITLAVGFSINFKASSACVAKTTLS